MPLRACWLTLFMAAAWSTVPLHARPPYKKALGDRFGPLLAQRLNDCVTCHLPQPAGAKDDDPERPHNVFGERLLKVRTELRKAGKPSDILDRLDAVADEDADGDGAPNLLEILSGRFPGDAKDAAGAAEMAAAGKALAAYRAKQAEYAWRPFEGVRRPPLAAAGDAGWARNPIDRFVAAEHARHGVTPRPPAAPHVLLRRLYLDVIGLPPTPAETAEFLQDCARIPSTEYRAPGERQDDLRGAESLAVATVPDAVWTRWVDRVLASPHYGERWGRHWMDVWRYSDWAGYGAEVRDSQPHIWRWRDWIVESLNQDKPYDRMIVEMLAGDEIAPTDPQVLRATGYLVRNWFKFNRDVWLDRSIEHTAKAFLGITMNCARCHDHFFDPITQQEYYQFRAFFEPHDIRTDRLPGSPDPAKDGVVRVFDAKLAAPTFLFIRGDDKHPDKKNPLAPAVPAALGGKPLTIAPVKLPAQAVFPEKQAWLMQELLQAHEAALNAARANLMKADAARPQAHDAESARLEVDIARVKLAALRALLEVETLEETANKSPAWEKAAIETVRLQREVKLLEARKLSWLAQQAAAKADAKTQPALQKKAEAARAALKAVEDELKKPPTTAYAKRITSNYPATSTGRRLGLARWIADPENPLTARVAVNHIWLRHFGKPLAPNTFDFGANGKTPSHPALLDWLAAEFMAPGGTRGLPPVGLQPVGAPGAQPWSMKHVHRLILTSAAYRMDSSNDPKNAAKDAENRWLWRMNVRRMEAEIVRDSVLAAAGQLDRALGGPEIDQNLGLTTRRRSLYYRYAPEKMMEFLTLFDSANVTECYERTESVVPQQALAMANSSLVLGQARLLTRDLMKPFAAAGPANAPAFVRAAFTHILGRAPSALEQSACELFLANQSTLLANPQGLERFSAGAANPVPPAADPQLRARESLVHVLMNHNEFVTIR